MIEDTTRMEGSRFNRVQVVVGSLTAKRISRRKNHGIYTVSVIKDKLGIWGVKKLRIEGIRCW